MSTFDLPDLSPLVQASTGRSATDEPRREADPLTSLGLGAGWFEGPTSGSANTSTASLDEPLNSSSELAVVQRQLHFLSSLVEDESEIAPDYLGWGPSKSDGRGGLVARGPFAYLGPDRGPAGHTVGWSAGAGLYSGQVGSGVRADVLQAQAHIGKWRDEEGTANTGMEADAAAFRLSAGKGAGRELAALTANAHIKSNENTTSAGMQANLLEGALTGGTKEHNARFGVGVGAGFGGRVHHGDADNDGVREYGFGFDIGPISADLRTEAIGHAANAAVDAHDTLTGNLVEFGPDPRLLALGSGR